MRKGIYAARDTSQGTTISEVNIAVRRPMAAQGPEDYYSWIGAKAPRPFAAGDALSWTQ